jgi:hypothetical protein
VREQLELSKRRVRLRVVGMPQLPTLECSVLQEQRDLRLRLHGADVQLTVVDPFASSRLLFRY